MKKLALLFSLFFLVSGFSCLSSLYAAPRDPIAVLYQVKGDVQYTRNGKKWRKVRRNKFLFPGYQIKTGANGSGRITNQKTGKNLQLNPNSIILVDASGLTVKSGELNKSGDSSKLLTGLMKRFTKSQSYTTVRRSVRKKTANMKAVRKIVLSQDYPYLVWENYGPEYSYQLTIGKDKYLVPASEEKIVQVKIKPFTDERHFTIEAKKDGKTALTLKQYRRKNYEINFLSAADQKQLDQELQTIEKNYPDNSFMMGSLYEKKGIWVAAMDQYKKYLANNPEEIEMTPYLFKIYKKLKLEKVWKEELAQYKETLLE